jgi:hypothetical protein
MGIQTKLLYFAIPLNYSFIIILKMTTAVRTDAYPAGSSPDHQNSITIKNKGENVCYNDNKSNKF